MLPLIPAAIASTIVMGYVLSTYTPAQTGNYPMAVAENVYLHHETAYRHIKSEGIRTGTFTDIFPLAIKPIGDWETRVVSNGRISAIITYQREGGPIADDLLHRAISYVSEKKLGILGNSAAGTYKNEGSSTLIGGLNVSQFAIPLDVGTPAIVSVVQF